MNDQDVGLDIKHFWGLVQASRVGILLIGVVFLALALAVAASLPKKYQAKAVTIIANERLQAPMMGGLASTLFDMGSGSEATYNIEFVRSFQFMDHFIDQYALQGEVFPDKWDNEIQNWREELNQDDIPARWILVATFSSRLTIDYDIRTNIVRFGFKGKDPEKSAKIVNDFITLANAKLLQQALSELDISIQSVQDKYERERITTRRKMLIDINERYESEKNLLIGKREYAFRVIDKAFPPYQPDRSLQILVILLAGFLWLSASCLLMITRHFYIKPFPSKNVISDKKRRPHGG